MRAVRFREFYWLCLLRPVRLALAASDAQRLSAAELEHWRACLPLALARRIDRYLADRNFAVQSVQSG